MLIDAGNPSAYGLVAGCSVAAGFLLVITGYLAVASAAAFAVVVVALTRHLPHGREVTGSRARGLVAFVLLAYLLPLLLLGRTFATIGRNPIFLPDLLLAAAALLMLPKTKWRFTSPAPLISACVALLAAHSVYVGISQGFPDATKGMVLVVYPLLSVVVAGWLAAEHNPSRLFSSLAGKVMPYVGLGPLLVAASGTLLIPAAQGLYLGFVAAFAAVPGVPRRRLLAGSAVIGLATLVHLKPERGPVLAVLLAATAAWVASSGWRPNLRKGTMIAGVSAMLATFALAASVGLINPTTVPGIGRVIARAVASPTSSEAEAANNITLRKDMWSYALSTTLQDNPIFGVGSFHPIEVSAFGQSIGSQSGSGVHNSFIGYVFYAGYPAGILVLILYLMGLWRLWRIRTVDRYAAALFGALVAVITTAMTNVAFETSYIGGPSWLALGAAFGLAGWHTANHERRSGSVDRFDGELTA